MEKSKAVWEHEMLFVWPCHAYNAFPSSEAHGEGVPVEIWGPQSVFQLGPSITAPCCHPWLIPWPNGSKFPHVQSPSTRFVAELFPLHVDSIGWFVLIASRQPDLLSGL